MQSESIPLCASGNCPYWNPVCNDPSGYGCTRFGRVSQCPSAQHFEIDTGRSEYALYGNTDPADFQDYTERWLLSDQKYHSDRAFQDDFGRDELPFPNRVITHPVQNFASN